MKRITKILMVIILLVTLTSCKGNSYRELFDKLYEENFESAKEEAIRIWGNEEDYEFSVTKKWQIFMENMGLFDVLKYKGIDRVILGRGMIDGVQYVGIDVIEFKSVEYAEKMMAEVNPINSKFARYENIVYNLYHFGYVFVYGLSEYTDGFMYNEARDVLYSDGRSGLRYKEEILEIPDSVKYITHSAIAGNTYIKEIICGENLEKIGYHAMRIIPNLTRFEANDKLKVIGMYALYMNHKLETVKLNSGLEYIGEKAFYGCLSLEYVVIPESVKYIENKAFNNGTLYCEIESKPSGWDDGFADERVKVYWGNEWEYNEEGIPVLIEE